jgi:hypothetical protein
MKSIKIRAPEERWDHNRGTTFKCFYKDKKNPLKTIEPRKIEFKCKFLDKVQNQFYEKKIT